MRRALGTVCCSAWWIVLGSQPASHITLTNHSHWRARNNSTIVEGSRWVSCNSRLLSNSPVLYISSDPPFDEDDPGPSLALTSTSVTGYLSRDSYHCMMEPTCEKTFLSVSKVSAGSSQQFETVMNPYSGPVSRERSPARDLRVLPTLPSLARGDRAGKGLRLAPPLGLSGRAGLRCPSPHAGISSEIDGNNDDDGGGRGQKSR